jgi:ribosomal protein S18 acetylase RimI-like enzyme
MNSPEIAIHLLDQSSDEPSIEAARALLIEYGQFVLSVEGPARFCFGKLDDEARGLPGSFAPPENGLLLAYVDGQAAGCVTWRAMAAIPGGCEMKRLWIRAAFRGLRLGESLTLELLKQAADAGYSTVYLDTFPETMGSAHRMYRRLGFVECERFHNNATPGIAFMRKDLV